MHFGHGIQGLHPQFEIFFFYFKFQKSDVVGVEWNYVTVILLVTNRSPLFEYVIRQISKYTIEKKRKIMGLHFRKRNTSFF